MCRTVFAHYDIDVFTVNVMTWKKDVVGNGKADKEKVMSMACKIYGEEVKKYSQDAVDALMVAKWGELRLK
jgi:Holliday junction resolvasome RuvABC endonuclease subunit